MTIGALGSLGTLAFLNPWILAGLIFLPALWFLLRVTPPAPRLIVFPAARFVAGLIPEEPTTSRTPWWILLLRLITLALIIFALAKPVLNPGEALPGSGAVRIVMDNSWAGAQTWTTQTAEAEHILSSAGREKREIHIMTTAPEPGADAPAYHGPMTQSQAEAVLRGLKPQPWLANYEEAVKLLKEHKPEDGIQSYWLSHGLKEGNNALAEELQRQGGLVFIAPEKSQLPVLLRPAGKITQNLTVLVSGPRDLPAGTPVTVNAVGADGRVLDSRPVTLDIAEKSAEIAFDIPDAVRNQVSQIHLAGRKGAGAVLLLDDQFKRRTVAIVTSSGAAENAPLIDEIFYIQRALEPYANLVTGTVDEILEKEPAVIILSNVGAMPPDELNALEGWVKDGGLLLRFAGPNMTQGENFLIPVPLLKGGRALDGTLTWDKPVKLAPFPESSPLYGMVVPEDVEVRRQLLAEPAPGLEEKTWAVLEDGTPLITADSLDNGMVVLVHTTATPLWSDLSLSGLFVQILRRVVNLAGSGKPQSSAGGMLQPQIVLDGFGAATQPKSFVHPIPSEAFDTTMPGPIHPPGLYGRAGYQRSLNLGDRLEALESVTGLPLGVETGTYGKKIETDLLPWLLAAAFALFMVDWVLMTVMQMSWRQFRVTARTAGCIALLLMPVSAHAQSEQEMATYADNIHLAFIKTGDPAVDNTVHKGLEALSEVLARRTSVEPSGTVAIDPETMELSFFPLIYWPVTADQKELSGKALQNIQYYIDHGGTILFDTRDSLSSTQGGGRNAEKLRSLIGGINIPPLVPAKDDHVLAKSFYLMDSFPGRYENGTLWVEEQSASGRDGVSSVIIGSNDWASAWASSVNAGPRISGGPQQQEMALRFGVNLVMYALTGNYKADQVHLPHILERLGQ